MTQDPFAEPRLYGRSFADVYDEWYADVSDANATARRIAELTEAGTPIVELGVGTGRLALPIAQLDRQVIGLDASRPMLQRLVAKRDAQHISALGADMSTLPLRDDSIGLILVAFNTLFNLPSVAHIEVCLTEAARALRIGGVLVVEAFVPPEPEEADDSGVSLRSIEIDRVVLSAARRDRSSSTIVGQHIEITETGIRLRPWQLTYASPTELDSMAARTGLALESRTASWSGEPFSPTSPVHVSVYRKGLAAGFRAANA